MASHSPTLVSCEEVPGVSFSLLDATSTPEAPVSGSLEWAFWLSQGVRFSGSVNPIYKVNIQSTDDLIIC